MITRTATDWKTGAAVKTTETLFVGATLAVHWNTTRVMSDIWETHAYATVFNAATGAVEIVWHDGTGATVDATPDALAGANAWVLAKTTEKRVAGWAENMGKALDAATRVAKGKTVTVVKGRKVPKGTTGEVFWLGDGRYGTRAGVKDAAGTVHWTAASNLEVVNPDDHFDYDFWVTNEPDHAADALAALNAGHKEVWLHAGEDRLHFGWFKAAALAAAA